VALSFNRLLPASVLSRQRSRVLLTFPHHREERYIELTLPVDHVFPQLFVLRSAGIDVFLEYSPNPCFL
jgi:hypothetical protein